jgi:hypothetical protein
MELQISLKKILKKGSIANELEFQRASIIDRQLRLLVKEMPELAGERDQLRDILHVYEQQHWVDGEVTDEQVRESDLAGEIAEQEREFLETRKKAIKTKLKELNLTQKDLGKILGHASATYMSELISGINPFTLNDLIIINRLLNIELPVLIPTTLNLKQANKIQSNISKLNHPKLKFKMSEFTIAS